MPIKVNKLKFFLSLAISISAHVAQAIEGGTSARPNDAINKSMVAIARGGKTLDRNCGGILIAPNLVLTAAHCARKMELSESWVAQSPKANKACAISAVQEIILPPDMKTNLHDLPVPDLMVLVLAKNLCAVSPLTEDELVAPVEGQDYVIAGYGTGTNQRQRFPDILALHYPGLSPTAFANRYYHDVKSMPDVDGATGAEYFENVVFALTEFAASAVLMTPQKVGTSACKGDSGGPVFSMRNGRVSLVGVISAGWAHPSLDLPACNDTLVQVIQPISPHKEWIKSIVKKKGSRVK